MGKLHFTTLNYPLDYTLHHKLSDCTLCTINYHTYHALHPDVIFTVIFNRILLHVTSTCFLLRWNKIKRLKHPSQWVKLFPDKKKKNKAINVKALYFVSSSCGTQSTLSWWFSTRYPVSSKIFCFPAMICMLFVHLLRPWYCIIQFSNLWQVVNSQIFADIWFAICGIQSISALWSDITFYFIIIMFFYIIYLVVVAFVGETYAKAGTRTLCLGLCVSQNQSRRER